MTNDLESIKSADTILVIGSNTTEAHPVIGSMIKERIQNGGKLIVCDPRKIELHKYAAVSIRHKSGSDVALINSIMNVILEENLYDEDFIAERVENFEELKKIVGEYNPEKMAKTTGISAETVREAARLYAKAENSAIFYTMGITQHTTGTNNVRTLANLALLCGMVGRPGTGVNPLRGQNNVQGACDMGALPATLPGYLNVGTTKAAEMVKKLWGCEIPDNGVPGLSVARMIDAASKGEIKSLYIVGENPMVTDADTNHVSEALDKLDFLVVEDIFLTPTAEKADVVLPASCWPEKDGTITNTIRAVQLLRKASESPGESLDDWKIFVELAKRFGHDWQFNSAEDVFNDIRRFTSTYAGMNYDRLDQGYLQWPCFDEEHKGTPILHTQRFGRENGKATFSPCDWTPPHEWPDEEYPFIATTGRSLFHYHSGSMTRRAATGKYIKELYIEINPEDAHLLHVEDGDNITVESRRGVVTGKAKVTDLVSKGMLFLPFHFAEAAANLLTAAVWDTDSETPGFKISAVKLSKI